MRIDRSVAFLYVVVGLLGGGFGGLLLWLPVTHLLQLHDASAWMRVDGKVIDVQLTTEADGIQQVKVSYVYRWEGALRPGNVASFIRRGSSELHRHHFDLLQLAQVHEAPVDVWVNPRRPEESVVFRDVDRGLLLHGAVGLMFFLPCAGIGLHGIALLVDDRRAGRRAARGAFLPRIAATPVQGRFELVDAEDTWRGHGAIGCAALFWNSITWTFVAVMGMQISQGELQGAGAVVGTLFMVPFVLLGIGLIVAWGKRLAVTFRMPAGRLSLSSWPIHPGDAVEALFRRPLRGARGGEELLLLGVALQVHEEATYDVGTDSRTDKATSRSLELEPTDSGIDARGIHARFLFELPLEGPCSFRSRSNLVTWRVHLTLQASGYPKDDSDFDLLVLPPGAAS